MNAPAKKLQMPRVDYENEPLGFKGWCITLGIFIVLFTLVVFFLPIEAVLSTSKYHFGGNRPLDQIAEIYHTIEKQDDEPFDTIVFGTSS